MATHPGVTILQRHLGLEVVVEFVEDGEVRGVPCGWLSVSAAAAARSRRAKALSGFDALVCRS